MNKQNFICETCNFHATNKYRFEYHMKSKRHRQISAKSQQITSTSQSNEVPVTTTQETIPENKYCKYHLPKRISADLSFTGFLDDKDIFYKLVKSKSDISSYLDIIYDQAMNYNEFILYLQIDYNDIKELKDIEPRMLINYKFTDIMYKILFKYLNKFPIDKRPIHFHNSLNNNLTSENNENWNICSENNTNWYIRENDKWRKLDTRYYIPTVDMMMKNSIKLTSEFYNHIMRPLLIQCICSWGTKYTEGFSESEKKSHYELGVKLSEFLKYCEKNYMFSIGGILKNTNPCLPSQDIVL